MRYNKILGNEPVHGNIFYKINIIFYKKMICKNCLQFPLIKYLHYKHIFHVISIKIHVH